MADLSHGPAELHLPAFITGPNETDVLFWVVVVLVLGLALLAGVIYFTLHALPEKLAHRTNSTQLQAVAILSLLAMFTHINLFWIAALLLAAVKLPDFTTPLNSIARSLEELREQGRNDA